MNVERANLNGYIVSIGQVRSSGSWAAPRFLLSLASLRETDVNTW